MDPLQRKMQRQLDAARARRLDGSDDEQAAVHRDGRGGNAAFARAHGGAVRGGGRAQAAPRQARLLASVFSSVSARHALTLAVLLPQDEEEEEEEEESRSAAFSKKRAAPAPPAQLSRKEKKRRRLAAVAQPRSWT